MLYSLTLVHKARGNLCIINGALTNCIWLLQWTVACLADRALSAPQMTLHWRGVVVTSREPPHVPLLMYVHNDLHAHIHMYTHTYMCTYVPSVVRYAWSVYQHRSTFMACMNRQRLADLECWVVLLYVRKWELQWSWLCQEGGLISWVLPASRLLTTSWFPGEAGFEHFQLWDILERNHCTVTSNIP